MTNIESLALEFSKAQDALETELFGANHPVLSFFNAYAVTDLHSLKIATERMQAQVNKLDKLKKAQQDAMEALREAVKKMQE
jgi:oligoribonuclease (3'-5' exoribonuclease)